MSGVTPTQRGELVTAALVRLLTSDTEPTVERVWSVVGDVARNVDLGQRRRFYLREVALRVETYRRVFEPADRWQLVGGNELVWRSQDGVFVDHLVMSTREAPVWTQRTRGVPRKTVKAGIEEHGSDFLGVRMLVFAAPGRSLLVDSPTDPPTLLGNTELWFGSPLLSAQQIAEQAAGGSQ